MSTHSIAARFPHVPACTMPRVVINKNAFGEFEVPERNGEMYFTADRDDAVATACTIYGDNVVIRYRKHY